VLISSSVRIGDRLGLRVEREGKEKDRNIKINRKEKGRGNRKEKER